MSDSTNTTNTQQGGGGLKKSTPLVTVQNVHAGVKTAVSMSTSIDHPLATPPPAAAPVVPPTQQMPTSSVEVSAQATPSPMPPASAAKTPPPVQKTPSKTPAPTVARLSKKSAKKQPKPASSLEDMADDFLSQPTDSGGTPKLKPTPLPKEQEGIERLRTLVVRRAWGDVLSVCGQMLRGPTSPYTQLYTSLISENSDVDVDEYTVEERQEVIEILTLECHAWLKLRRYNELGREVDKWNFLNTSDSSETSSLSWVPWSLHILAAESLQYTDASSARCTDALYSLRDVLVEKKEYAWLTSVDNALANAFLKRKEWRLAFSALDNMMTSIPGAVGAMSSGDPLLDDMESCLTTAFRCEVLTRQGRIMLQSGALHEAATLFEEAKTTFNTTTASTNTSKHWIFQYLPIQFRISDGLLSFAHSHYDAAMTHFRKSVEMLQTQTVSEYNKEDWMGPTVLRVDAYSVALSNCCNNLALCALYTCRMQDAVRMMESMVQKDPSSYLTERLAFNLATLYELGSDAAASNRKKRVLQLIAKRFFLHDIGPESFRVS